VAGDGECENFHRSARALPATSGHAGHIITCRYDTAGHSLNSRLCRAPGAAANNTDRLHADEFVPVKPACGTVHGAALIRPSPTPTTTGQAWPDAALATEDARGELSP
jgi:hypothetical protein